MKNESIIKIYRDGKLDRWMTYRSHIVPMALAWQGRVFEAIDSSPTKIKRVIDVLDNYTQNLANQ